MFIARKRSTVLLMLIFMVSLWVVFQNVSLHKSLFRWTHIRQHAVNIQLSQLQKLQKNLNIKRVSFEFHPPPAYPGETQSEGYNVEDMYFRRWQVAHHVEPKRAVRERTEERRWKGWSTHHNSRLPENNLYDTLRKRQEDRLHLAEQMRRRHDEEMQKQSEEMSDDDNDTDTAINEDSSSFTVQRTWLKARLENYCNDKGIMKGDEGIAPDGYRLRSVHVLARHGDRTPLENGKTGKLAPFQFECSLTEANKKIGSIHMEKFLRVMQSSSKDVNSLDQEMKSLILRIPLRNSRVACYASQLTPHGWVQHMRLGDFLKKRYWKQLQLSSEHGATQKLAIKSTQSPRTIQSAIAFLFGFLPKFSVLDVSKIKRSDSPTFCSERNCHCGAVDKLRESVVDRYHSFHKEENTKNLSSRVSRLMYVEDPLYSVPNPSRLIELLTARACHHSALPCTENGCVDEAMFEQVFQEVDSISGKLRAGGNSSAELYGRLAMHPLLSTISLTMRYIDRGQNNLPRFYLYMGHDITLTPFLDALGMVYPWPGYASRVVIEHWYHSDSEQSAIKILYNGVDVTYKVSFCAEVLNTDGLCPFEAYYKFIDTDNLRVFNAMTYDEACTWGIGE
ncbi:2-phosphoxylose phosphatase 1-like [Apostichopus japonicus]|uniref:2-phosphoxylose phosphatase 1-like n=1 Tax=Stichopus japonicus TaxID=307972 RepID=UPI003AB73046